MEHLNKIAKEAAQSVGANKSKNTMERIGKAIGTLSPVLDQFDFVNKVQGTSELNRVPDDEAGIKVTANELLNARCFQEHAGRMHKKVPKPRDILKIKTQQQLIQ